MAEIKALLAIILLLSFIHIPKASSKPSGFSLNLICAYPPISENNTFFERYEANARASEARASYWASFHKSTANKTFQPDIIHSYLKKEGNRIVVTMKIGTPGQQVFLEFDTGSLITWTQCASCTTCFPQSTTKFNPRLSSTYRVMSSDDPFCNFRVYNKSGHQCLYKTTYIVGQETNGIVSYDTFADINPLGEMSSNRIVVTNLRFGCSLEASGFRYPPNTIISGILGMSRTVESLPGQMKHLSRIGRFSYCLVDINTSPSVMNKVTFGNDVPYIPRESLSTVPFINHTFFHTSMWVINLHDISVGNQRLNLPSWTFAPSGSGGLLIDTGSPFTHITRNVYYLIKSKIQDHLSRSVDFTQIQGKPDLCYRYNRPTGQLPTDFLQTITFHLDNGVNFVMPVTSVYFFNRAENTFCFGMMPAQSEWPNIMGSLAQQDKRLIYDSDRNSLSFKPEHCASARNQA